MFANSASAFNPWIALRSWASSKLYSAFSALDLAVTVTFSILNAIWLKASLPVPSSDSASPVGIPWPTVYCAVLVAAVPTGLSAAGFVPAWVTVPKPTFISEKSLVNVVSEPASVPEKAVSASLNSASVPLWLVNLDLIAKIKPVGPDIGWTPARS